MPGRTASTAVGEGKISFDLSEQDGGEIPFVVYATVPFEGTDISGTAVPFKFATSVMKVNVTGLKAGCTVQNATVVSPSSSGRTMDITDSSANIFSTGFTASALAAGKSYNSVYALRQMPALVDLGLPSGTKWASQDLQASSVFESGSPFTWTEDDAATAILGTGWSRPTTSDWSELMEECTWTWVPAINCLDVTGPNGNSILFVCPNDPGYPGTWYHATYWTSDLYPDAYEGAVRTVYLSWDDDKEPEERISHDFTIQSREDFYPIRPVFKQ